ncbi:hypothetical protein TNCV_165711 [Trichonephila clavipes]|nr:hypothetical protein TNCV_165711 [Trichonephila clavipes]
MASNSSCGCGSLVVKITDSWLVCHEFEDPPCRGVRSTLNIQRLKRPLVDVVWYTAALGSTQWEPESLPCANGKSSPATPAIVHGTLELNYGRMGEKSPWPMNHNLWSITFG